MSGSRHLPKRSYRELLVLLALAIIGLIVWRVAASGDAGPSAPSRRASTQGTSPGATKTAEPAPTPKPTPIKTPGPINTKIPGLTTWRGNATRTYYGEGPVPRHPVILWSYPEHGEMCAVSTAANETKKWCGTGWTGQPNVIPHADGTIEIREGAYDDRYHFLDGRTGEPLRPDLLTGDLAKGSATSDPDGYPLYYGGSRDNLLRVVALDRPSPTVLWEFDSRTQPGWRWNTDWDGAPLVVGDYLLEGGENSWFYVIRLNRHYGDDHLVHVSPKIVMRVPGWDDRLLADVGDGDVSIENSVAFDPKRGVVYFANSGGLVQGWNISDVLHGGSHHERVFRFWTGDDTDATVVIGRSGALYVGSEYQRFNPRSREVGQIMKLDPSRPDDPLVWSIPATDISFEDAGGTWSTPALYGPWVYESTVDGRLMQINAESGHVVWSIDLTPPVLSSPVVVDGVLIEGDCSGVLHAWNVAKDPRRAPKPMWNVSLGTCIESTPAVWHGMLWVGTRGGKIFAIGDRS
jgi:outer membrane protein assembly factor BamB